jgi:hypothetical protein
MADRSFALVQSADQWLRSAHDQTALIGSVVQLHWHPDQHDTAAPAKHSPIAAGLTFDPWCRLYHSRPEQGQVERVLWGTDNQRLEPVQVFATPPEQPTGDFAPVESPLPLAQPRALAVSDEGRLFVGEAAAPRVVIFDLFERRLLRRVEIPSNGRPLDMACDGRRVFVLVDSEPYLYVLDAWSDIRPDVAVSAGWPMGKFPCGWPCTRRVSRWFCFPRWESMRSKRYGSGSNANCPSLASRRRLHGAVCHRLGVHAGG